MNNYVITVMGYQKNLETKVWADLIEYNGDFISFFTITPSRKDLIAMFPSGRTIINRIEVASSDLLTSN